VAGESGGTAITVNVADAEAMERAVAAAVEAMGGLTCLVNNAGMVVGGPVDGPSYLEDFQRTLDVDLTAHVRTIRAALPHLKASGAGRIVNIASTEGSGATKYNSSYVAAKHGVIGLTKTAALEYVRHNIRVNAVCPGTIETPFIGDLVGDDDRARAALLRTQPGGAFGTPDDVANAVVWLCSDAAGFVTGTALTVDGGAVEAQGVLLDH
jgi:NAD(P)-dependent dehydrogenase (short-subunit alcohol dehydrogenase family)